uniref:Microtubule associated protein 9 n=1 Tax=Rousettus aegyptiacus TaxID=9407 RepID=A0A7J8BTH3_ROUAE|nr:microtubule associated protein 9 [Rousettus aegyptiacus]
MPSGKKLLACKSQDSWLISLSSSSLKESIEDSFSRKSGGKTSIKGGYIKLLYLILFVNPVLLRILQNLFVNETMLYIDTGTMFVFA